MSIAVLIQVYDEVRRLAIAGSAVACGDFRLKKLIPPLEQSGEKSPVFAKVAQATRALVESTDKTAAPAMLELTTLVNAILYTQGETGLEGPLQPIPTTDLGIRSTHTSARVIKPLIEALTTKGSGRVEIIKDAVERNLFRDLRLIKPAVTAIDDPYSEIADLIVTKVLPLYGKSILPDLRIGFDVKSKVIGQQRRLKLMHDLDPTATRELVEKALEEGSKEMRVAAIECLGASDADVGYLIEQSKATSQEVRSAALRAMLQAPARSVDMIKSLLRALAGDDLGLIASVVVKARVPAIDAAVIDHATQQLAILAKEKDAKKLGPAIGRMIDLVTCTRGRSDSPTEKLLFECLDQAPSLAKLKTHPAGTDLNEVVACRLAQGSEAMQRRLATTVAEAQGQWYDAALYAACVTMATATFYERFNSQLLAKSKKRGTDAERSASLHRLLIGHSFSEPYGSRVIYGDFGDAPRARPALDPRWLDLAVERDQVDLVCALARPGHAKANAYLADHLGKLKDLHEKHDVMSTMLRVQHPMAEDALINLIKATAKATGYIYSTYQLVRLIGALPKAALPRVEALIPELPDKFVDSIIDGVAELRTKPH